MKRPKDMPFDVYKEVRKDMNKKLKERKRGHVEWDSAKKGTFTKDK